MIRPLEKRSGEQAAHIDLYAGFAAEIAAGGALRASISGLESAVMGGRQLLVSLYRTIG